MSDGPFAPGDTILKDPQAVLDYLFDWSEWLGASETITTKAVAIDIDPDTLLVINSSTIQATTGVLVWLSAGTLNEDYKLRCRITTSAGRTDDRSVTIRIRQR